MVKTHDNKNTSKKSNNKQIFALGAFSNLLNKNIKEFNQIKLSIICIVFLISVGFISYKINSSYAIFSDEITGSKTIEIEVVSPPVEPNKPVLDNAMIPVYYDETSGVWKKADSTNKNNNWYNYDEKKWANSVTVSSTNRSAYQSASVGTTIPMNDILTMQVWIPRYKYKVWNYNSDGTKTSNEQEIEITFESGTNSTGKIFCTDNIQGENGDGTSEICKMDDEVCTDDICNNKTYTHPAFTFGDKELDGFWVGKFEYRIYGGVIPGVSYQECISCYQDENIANFFSEIIKMKNNGNKYGFSTSTDTHMIKNMEWGAVAYLSRSKYGTCDNGKCLEVGINDDYDYTTGCGPDSSSGCNEYNTENGMLASTTHNVYGIYDMNGGMSDFVMANMVDSDGKTMIPGQSGFDTYPDSKYYDKYSYRTSSISTSKLGDAIKEISVIKFLFSTTSSWLIRGAFAFDDSDFFSVSNVSGVNSVESSAHIIIIP